MTIKPPTKQPRNALQNKCARLFAPVWVGPGFPGRVCFSWVCPRPPGLVMFCPPWPALKPPGWLAQLNELRRERTNREPRPNTTPRSYGRKLGRELRPRENSRAIRKEGHPNAPGRTSIAALARIVANLSRQTQQTQRARIPEVWLDLRSRPTLQTSPGNCPATPRAPHINNKHARASFSLKIIRGARGVSI